jgi:hypothetical protein
LQRDLAISFATYSLPVQLTQLSVHRWEERVLKSQTLINYLMQKTG